MNNDKSILDLIYLFIYIIISRSAFQKFNWGHLWMKGLVGRDGFSSVQLVTEFPACLNQRQFWIVDEERNAAMEKIRFRLEVRVEYRDVVTRVHVRVSHSLLQCARLVPGTIHADLILDVDAFARPALHLRLHQFLHFTCIFRMMSDPHNVNLVYMLQLVFYFVFFFWIPGFEFK